MPCEDRETAAELAYGGILGGLQAVRPLAMLLYKEVAWHVGVQEASRPGVDGFHAGFQLFEKAERISGVP